MMPRVVTAMPVAPATPRGMVRGDNAHDGVSDRGAGRPSARTMATACQSRVSASSASLVLCDVRGGELGEDQARQLDERFRGARLAGVVGAPLQRPVPGR